jgi:acetyltransferase-like isoleucine patch superfamily enzyme
VVISGQVHIGAYTFIGVNATLRDSITVGQLNVIGAGALIMKSTKDHEVYVPERTKPYPKTSDQINF